MIGKLNYPASPAVKTIMNRDHAGVNRQGRQGAQRDSGGPYAARFLGLGE